MKIRITLLAIFTTMFFKSFSQSSKLSKTLDNWIKKPNTELSKELNGLSNVQVKSVDEAKLICKSLQLINKRLSISFDDVVQDNLYQLILLFQNTSTTESATYLNGNGISLLVEALRLIISKNHENESIKDNEMMMLKMMAMYSNDAGLDELSKLINQDFRSDAYLWVTVMSYISREERKCNFIIEKLAGKIPSKFLGITYLDMCNAIAIKSGSFKHPFNTSRGYSFLDSVVKNSPAEDESYLVSVTASIPFIAKPYQDSLLELVGKNSSVDVQIELAWAGAKLGKEKYLDMLVAFAADYRYSRKAVEYLRELDFVNKIPPAAIDPDFEAMSEMCGWLAHPNEFGKAPDTVKIYDKRELYWPPTKDKRMLFLIEYRYKKYNQDGSDEVGVGMVGSITFSLFGITDLNKMKPLEIYAIHCNWEMEKKNYEDIKSGMELLKKYNKKLE